MIGLSTQQALLARMDVTANNLANMTTAGFKAERLVLREDEQRPAAVAENPSDVAFVDAWRLQRDFSGGAVERTGNPLDLAIKGDGFFTIQTADGVAYTRDGRFSMNVSGQLVTRSGKPVLSGGSPVRLDPAGGDVVIQKNGAISQGGKPVGTLDLVNFTQPAALEKIGDNLWKSSGELARPATGFEIQQSAIENSNVNPVREITEMVEVSRAYQSVSHMIDQSDELRAKAIDKLSRLS